MNYDSVQDIVNAGITNMTVLVNNSAYDNNSYTISNIPQWIKFNSATPTTLYASGNSWFGTVNSSGATSTGQFNFNTRDCKMYYLYKEEGTLHKYINFYKLRWRGYSAINSTGSSYLQEWELYFFSTGDIMIHAINIPTSNYGGKFTVVASSTYTYTKPTTTSPFVSFYTQDNDNTTFSISYEIIDIPIPFNTRWLIKDGDVLYNIENGELNPLTITEITGQNMLDYGNETAPDSELLKSLTYPTIYKWNDSNETETTIPPTVDVIVTAYPPVQIIDYVVDMNNETITGISLVTANYSGTVGIQYSLDEGTTYVDEITMAEFLNLNFSDIFENLPLSKLLYMRILLYADSTLTGIKFNYEN